VHIGARNGVHAVRSSRFDRILLRWVTNRMPAAAAALALWPAPGPAQDGSLEEIEVTGSRIARRDFTSASPIVSVPAEAFRESSSVSVERTLGQLPQFVPTATGTSNSPANDGQANLSLRGIGSVQTLVLVDGKRLMPADGLGTVDLNVLPPALIESVEVVTGGASAAYGSDAIAGVVNFRLRDRYEGVELHGEWSQTDSGDGREYSAGILAGNSFAAGRGDVIAYLGYAEREQVNQGERGFSRHAWGYFPGETVGFGPGGAFLPQGTGITEEGVSVVFASPTVFNQVFIGYGYPPGSVPYQAGFGVNLDRTVFTIGDGRTPNSVVNFRGEIDPATYNDRFFNYDTAPTTALQMPLERTSAIVRARFKLSPSAESYGQLLLADYSVTRQLAPTGTGLLLVPVTNPYVPPDLRALAASRPDPAAPFRFQRLMPEVGPRRAENDRTLLQGTLGLRGEVFTDWRYEVYVQLGRNERTERQSGNVRISRFEELLTAPDGGVALCGGFDPFGRGRVPVACAEYATTDASNEITVEQALAEASLNGPLLELPAGALRSAVGVFYKRDDFSYVPDPVLTEFVPAVPGLVGPRPDVTGFGAGAARSGDESNVDVYAELLVPIYRDASAGRFLDLGLGYRRSEYEQAGGADAYKVELTFRPQHVVLLRGSFQHAVRAPSIEELYYPEIPGQLLFAPPDPCAVSSPQRNGPDWQQVEALCLAQGMTPAQLAVFEYPLRRVDGVRGGNPDLAPEEADTATAGVVLGSPFEHDALRELQLSVDWYRIDFTNGIGRWAVDSAKDRCFDPAYNPTYDPANGYCRFFTRVPATGEIFGLELNRNIGGVDTSGVDVQIDWSLPAGPGQLAAAAFVSYVDEWQAVEPNGAKVEYAGTIGNRGLGSAIPRWRSLLTLRYDWLGAGAYLRWQHVDGMRDAEYADFRVPARDNFDVGANHAFESGALEGLDATVGIENLFDEQPPVFPSYSQANTDPSLYDVLGRRWFFSLRYRF